MQVSRHARATLLRQRKLPAIRLLFVALVLAVSTVTMISVVTELLGRSIGQSSAQFMAADRQLVGPTQIDDQWLEMAESFGLTWTRGVEFSSMLVAGESLQLVRVKAVDDGYPLKGKLLSVNDDRERVLEDSGPTQHSIWLQPRLFPLLDVDRDGEVAVGNKILTITHSLAQEPDSGFEFEGVAPKVLMHFDDVEATGVVQPGSRLSWRYYFVGDETQLAAFDAWLKPKLEPLQRWEGVREGRPAISEALDKTDTYLLLAGSLAVLLSFVAIAMAARQFALSQIQTVAIMKTLGLNGRTVLAHYGFQLLSLVVLAGVIGLVIGFAAAWALQSILSQFIAELLPPSLDMISLRVILLALFTATIALFAFALPQFVQLRHISPMVVLREKTHGAFAWSPWATAIALLGIIVLLWVYGGSLWLVGLLMGGIVGLSFSLLVVGYLISLFSGRIARNNRKLSAQALANLFRRRWNSLIQLNVFSLAIFLFAVLFLARETLLNDWQTQVPEDAPNHFLINIAPNDMTKLAANLQRENLESSGLFPLVRARLSHINGVEAKKAASKERNEALNRELNLTWADILPSDNQIEQGEWWSEVGDTPHPGVSVESELAEQLDIKMGDTLRFAVQGRDFDSTVTSIRSVQWDSMKPNFYMMFEPGSLDRFSSTYITAFFLPPDKKPFLNELNKDFPSVSIVELDHVVKKVRTIVDQVSSMIELILAFVLIASLLVISALVNSSMSERVREAALLRTLGASSARISGVQMMEFAFFGLIAGLIAILVGEVVIWGLQQELFGTPVRFHYELWLIIPIASALLISVLSYMQIRHVPRTAPVSILRDT